MAPRPLDAPAAQVLRGPMLRHALAPESVGPRSSAFFKATQPVITACGWQQPTRSRCSKCRGHPGRCRRLTVAGVVRQLAPGERAMNEHSAPLPPWPLPKRRNGSRRWCSKAMLGGSHEHVSGRRQCVRRGSSGQPVFPRPAAITNLVEHDDGTRWAFVEGSSSAVSVDGLTPTSRVGTNATRLNPTACSLIGRPS